jgi:CHAT domain-containing protein
MPLKDTYFKFFDESTLTGAPSVIVTLWKIPDDTTSLLMTDFYQNLQSSPDKAGLIINS